MIVTLYAIHCKTQFLTEIKGNSFENAVEKLSLHGCSPWRAACSGARRLVLLPSVGTHVEQCLKGGPHGMEPCWSSAWRAAACGKPTQDQFGKDSIPWEGPHAGAGTECP